MTGRLCHEIVVLCDEAAARRDGSMAAKVEGVRSSLHEPLRVAIAGRVNAGKSTLVNALMGRRVAPTKPTECTQLVTWYRFDIADRVDVHGHDGTITQVQLAPDGRLPASLGVPIELVDHLEVYLSESLLQQMTLIDTPGLAGMNDTSAGQRSKGLLGLDTASRDAGLRAEAVVFVFTAALRGDERDVLRGFHDVSAAVPHHSPVNAIGVLSKVDVLADVDEDPWAPAQVLATSFQAALSHEVAAVAPVAGLLAETVASGAFSEADASAIAALAEMPAAERDRLLRSVDRFRTREAPVSPSHREDLLLRLDLYGVRLAVEACAAGARGAAAIGKLLFRTSRLEAVQHSLQRTFARRADVIKAGWALGALGSLAYDREVPRADRLWIADAVESLRLSPAMHALAELEAVNDIATGAVTLPDELATALYRLVDGATPGERLGVDGDFTREQLKQVGQRLSDQFHRFAFDAAPREAHASKVGHRSCQLLIEALSSERSPA